MSLPCEHVEDPAVEEWCQTKLELKSYKFKWTINNFSWCSEQCGSFIESSKFPANATDCEPLWSLRAFPRGEDDDTLNFFNIAIVSHGTAKAYGRSQITVLSDKKDCVKSDVKTFHFRGENSVYGTDICIDRSDLMDGDNGYLPLDTLTILCKVSVVHKVIKLSGQSNAQRAESAKNKLWQDFEHLYTNKSFCDVTLITSGGEELKAHKLVLVARSVVFAAMFKHEMQEQKLCRISIEDIKLNVLDEMLFYMYTATAPNLDTMAEDLLIAADKYALEDLKKQCEESLIRTISVENVANMLILADRYNSQELKLRAIDFILENATAVMDTEVWRDMTITNPCLTELLSLMAQKFHIS